MGTVGQTTIQSMDAVIACDVFREEIESLRAGAPGIGRVEWIDMALHERPPVLVKRLAAVIERLEAEGGFEHILLAYGLCGQGTVGLGGVRATLVIPRAHDCVSVFLGGRRRHEELLAACPHTYFFLPGWNRGGRAPTAEQFEKKKAEYAAQFDEEEAEFLIETDLASMKHHRQGVHVDTGLGDQHLAVTEKACSFHGFELKVEQGTGDYLKALLTGPWEDDRFLVVSPGKKITHRAGSTLLEAT